ncbi:MAG: preprotein translocase subunit SecE [Candidatus Nomurabacteria bacterium]|jgi:preprotein translocase SecE subunit|nr:preprotein translocase subunit SecE [Candidatus Nomurabacteria bacterium]
MVKKDQKEAKKTRNPLKMLWNYIKASFRELKEVRFPNGKATRKMLFGVLVYVGLIFVIIWALDILFNWMFKAILS